MGTLSGLDCFSETRITSLCSRDGLPFDQNLILQATADGSVWAGNNPRGFEEIKAGTKEFLDCKWLSAKGTGTVLSVFSLYADPAGGLLMGTGVGVLSLPKGAQQAELLPGTAGLTSVDAMARDQSGTLWLSDLTGIYRVHDAQKEKVPDPRLGVAFAAYAARDGGCGSVLNAGWFAMKAIEVRCT